MKRKSDTQKAQVGLPVLMLLAATALISQAVAAVQLPEPGPESGGLRLRFLVTPKAEGTNEGYDVQVDLVSVSREAIVLRAKDWTERSEIGFKGYLEAATSIESYPAIEPWHGPFSDQERWGTPSHSYTLKSSGTLSVKWHTTGRRLKNKVSYPLKVQNPEFTDSGLYSVHASVVFGVAGREVLLRSKEQLVPIGGSRESPKHTYGSLWMPVESMKNASLDLGSLHKIVPGDRFAIRTGSNGMMWTMTITTVGMDASHGTLEPSQVNPTPPFPRDGAMAALIPTK